MKNQNPLKEDIYILEINFSNFHILLTAACCPKRNFYTHTLENATDFCTALCLLVLGTKTQQNSHRKAANIVVRTFRRQKFVLHAQIFFSCTPKNVFCTPKKSHLYCKNSILLKKNSTNVLSQVLAHFLSF